MCQQKMAPVSLLMLLSVAVLKVNSQVTIYDDDPYSDVMSEPGFEPEPEEFTNQTMDQLITESLGGLEGYLLDHFMEEDGTFIAELDMRLTSDQFGLFYGDFHPPVTKRRKKRKATRPVRYRWTNGEIPYEFISSHFSASEVYTIKKALQEWTDATCLRFRPARSGDRNRIRFQNGAGCNSALGMVGGTQVINLQTPGCRYKGLYLHEVGHALGLVHEHQLPDRDQYITILYNNVSPSMRIWFNKYSTREVNQYGVPYEYSSVMHYGVTAFSHDGRSQTIRAKDRSREREIGNVWAKGLSFSDIKVVNLMYNCNAHCTASSTCNSPGYLDKNCRCVCPRNVDCSTGGGGGGGGGGGSTTTTSQSTTTTYMPSPPPDSTTTEAPSPPPETTTTTGCTNEWPDNQCNPWAARGECDANAVWMREHCRKACGACGTGTTTYMPSPPPDSTTTEAPSPPIPETTTTTVEPPTHQPETTPTTTSTTAVPSPPTGATTTTEVPSPPTGPTTTTTTTTTTTVAPTTPTCVNRWGDSQCIPWANIGECTRNSVWMRTNCAKSCGVCTGTGTVCRDTDNNCRYWSGQGYCGRSRYMEQHCKLSCRRCGRASGGTSSGGGSTCQDRLAYCPNWQSHGYCNSPYYAVSMRINCRASCGWCQ